MAGSLGDLLVTVGANIQGFKSAMSDVSSTLDKTGGKADKFGGILEGAFRKMFPAATAAGVLSFIYKSGEEFENASVKIRRATGATAEQMDGLETVFKRLYASSAASSDTVATALSKIAVETKTTGNELQLLTQANLKFAKVTGVDVVQAIDSTQTVFKQFGITAEDQAASLDILYRVMTETGANVTELAGQLAATGPALRSFGFSFAESAALAGQFEEAGIKLDSVLGALRLGMVKLAESGKNPREELTNIIEKMRGASTEADAVNMAAETFGRRGAVVLADAVRRGAFETGELAKKLNEAKGSIDKAADATQTLHERWVKAQHEFQVSAAPTGNFILKWATSGMEAVSRLNVVLSTTWAMMKNAFGAGAKETPAPQLTEEERWKRLEAIYLKTGQSASAAAEETGKLHDSTKKAAGAAKEAADAFAAIPFREKSLEAALLVAKMDEAAKKQREIIDWLTRYNNGEFDLSKMPELPEIPGPKDDSKRTVDEILSRTYEPWLNGQDKVIKKTKETAKAWDSMRRQVSTVITDLSRSLTDVIFKTRSLGDAFKSVGISIVRIILENIIGEGIEKLMTALSGLLSHLGSVGKALAGIVGSGASGAASAAASGAASAGGTAAGAGSAVAGGLSGWIGAIGSIGSMISGVIGNFQNARMEGTLNAIELNTRRSGIFLGEGDSIHSRLGQIRNRLWDFTAGGFGFATLIELTTQLTDAIVWGARPPEAVAAGGYGAVIEFNNCTFSGVTRDLVSEVFTEGVRQIRQADTRGNF